MENIESTLVLIKPDAIQRGLIADILQRFERKGFQLIGMKMIFNNSSLLKRHYHELATKPFFSKLIEFMNSGPIICTIWKGLNAVKIIRTMLGTTDPSISPAGTIRGDFAVQTRYNVCHASDSLENAKKEISIWFEKDEIIDWKSCQQDWIFDY